MRNELREKNLHDTEEPPLEQQAVPADLDPALRRGTDHRRHVQRPALPKMGAAGRRFGRNVPLEHTFPDTPNLLVPNPRDVSRELMTRDQFQPATILNLLAAAWIQFMVHDWFVHKRSETERIDIPTAAGDDWGAPSMRVPRSVPDPAPAGSTRPPAYANLNSHWWDCVADLRLRRRHGRRSCARSIGGKLRIEPTGLLPVDPETGVHFTGFTDNWWIGLAMLHTLFTLEHNHICDLLAHEHPDWNDDQLFRKAKLINSALHGQDPHRRVDAGDRAAPDHQAGDERQLVRPGRRGPAGAAPSSSTTRSCSAASSVRRPTITRAPYSLTEEFVSVYRMHPLMPDDFAFHSPVTGRLLEKRELHEIAGRRTPAIAERLTMPDLFYSFGTCHPGAVTLHNYPRHLQNLPRDDGEHLDLAAVDILRDRERGVPRYNQFRRLLHKHAGQVVRRAHRQPGVAQADQDRSTTTISRAWT